MPTLVVGVAGGSGTFGGTIKDNAGTACLIKAGSGTQTLSGANTYTGGTTVNAGKLVVRGTVGGGASPGNVNVPGGTLEVDGQLTAAVLDVTLHPAGGQGSGQLAGTGTIALGGDGLFYNSSVTSTFAGTIQGAAPRWRSTAASWSLPAATPGPHGRRGRRVGRDQQRRPARPGSLKVDAGGTFVFDPNYNLDNDALRPRRRAVLAAGGPAPVPEPGTLGLLGVGALVAGAVAGRRRR